MEEAGILGRKRGRKQKRKEKKGKKDGWEKRNEAKERRAV